MRNNKLNLNDEKTLLLVMDTGQSRGRVQAAKQVEIRTPAGTIRPSSSDWTTSPAVLLSQVGWLSVNQLIFYHSVLQIYKVNKSQTPKYLDNMFSWTFNYNTRQAVGGLIRLVGKPKLDITRNSFRWRAANQFNQLPAEIRTYPTLASFKIKAKTWLTENVSFS